jgi:pyruvate dehydrogenase E1 component
MVFDSFKQHLPDVDPGETEEWMESLESVLEAGGSARAQFLLYRLLKRARQLHIGLPETVSTRYINSISPEQEPEFPGDEQMERRIRRLIRWNAAVMVTRANKRSPGLGGHISTYASSASLYEIGFNHFFRGPEGPGHGDFIFYQGHAAPGIYARAFLEGRLTQDQLDHFRMESRGGGLSSYPHPRLMPNFWEFPTVSMGLGPINAIYLARFLRYVTARGIADASQSRVWCFIGDGESDEPECLGAISVAAREGLDNLTFVVNCNLQRLDGPVRGNGKIVQELESNFRGSGWNVLKVLLGREWDALLKQDVDGVLVNRLMETLDGDYQRYVTQPGSVVREEFFGGDERLAALVRSYTDEELKRLRMGGHDYRKLYAAYKVATEHHGAPTAILARTVKGWTLGEGFEARNMTHQMKQLNEKELRVFRDRLELPIPDAALAEAPYYHPGDQSPEVQYMRERRKALGGSLPQRRYTPVALDLPAADLYAEFHAGTGPKVPVSTTMAFVRLLRKLMKDDDIGDRIVPIIPDEARTFGMESLFREFKIYAAHGQKYKPVDADVLLSYTEGSDGQILEEGITEAGALASFTASGTSYATVSEPTIPFFILYSMFGFQRVADLIWAFADSRGRGFLMGATYGRTTLNGEGLQHQDGHSLLTASTVPSCLAYDPAFHYETAVIVEDGMRRMYVEQEDVFYYITLYNENYEMPAMPKGAHEGILKGLYRLKPAGKDGSHRAHILGSGTILMQALEAQRILEEEYDVAADVWSATSYSELRRDALTVERENRLKPGAKAKTSHVEQCFSREKAGTPIVAVSDSMKAVPDQIARWMPDGYQVLGTDGFGRSDTRANLRDFFEIDAKHIVYTVLYGLLRSKNITASELKKAAKNLKIDIEAVYPALAWEAAPKVPGGGAAAGDQSSPGRNPNAEKVRRAKQSE